MNAASGLLSSSSFLDGSLKQDGGVHLRVDAVQEIK